MFTKRSAATVALLSRRLLIVDSTRSGRLAAATPFTTPTPPVPPTQNVNRLDPPWEKNIYSIP